jgi:hypothetical protein
MVRSAPIVSAGRTVSPDRGGANFSGVHLFDNAAVDIA